MATPVTQAPPHVFASRLDRIEARRNAERCTDCRHFSGNHVHYVWRSECQIDGCTCGHMIALPCGCEYANHRYDVHPGSLSPSFDPARCSEECAARGHASILKFCDPHRRERGCID